jgi:hypothetical protein
MQVSVVAHAFGVDCVNKINKKTTLLFSMVTTPELKATLNYKKCFIDDTGEATESCAMQTQEVASEENICGEKINNYSRDCDASELNTSFEVSCNNTKVTFRFTQTANGVGEVSCLKNGRVMSTIALGQCN